MLRDSFQVHKDPAYEMGFPIEPINLGIEVPKPGDVAITAAHRAIRAFFYEILASLLGRKFTFT